MSDFKRQRGTVELVGYITGLDRQKGKDGSKPYNKEFSSGTKYREIGFNIKTNHDESGRVRIRAIKKDMVWYSDKDNVFKSVKWANRNKLPEGARLMGQISYHTNELKNDGKYNTKYQLDYYAIEDILESFKDGDAVRVRADIEYNAYNEKIYRFNNVTHIYHSGIKTEEKEVQSMFDNEDFTPTRKFKQTFVFDSYDFDKDTDTHRVLSRVIVGKDGNNIAVDFEINPDNEQMIKSFKRVTAGTEMTVHGDYTNSVVEIDLSELTEDDEFGFSESDDYAETLKEYDRAAANYIDNWVIKVVSIRDIEGNKLIIKDKYDIDDLDDARANFLDEQAKKNNGGGSKNDVGKNKDDSSASNSNNDNDDNDDWDI